MGTAFIDRMPAMLRGFAMHHFGPHGGTVLLLGLIAVIAIAIGAAARRSAALGVAGVAAFALVVAFVTVTRPASHVSDVMPAVIGGLAGVAALLWLVRASAPIQEVTPLRSARGGTRRRTR
jgi:membrane-bound ClpP family serine protease